MASANSASKGRPLGFDREALFQSLKASVPAGWRLVVILDCGPNDKHFTEGQADVVRVNAGCDSKSFMATLQYASLQDADIIVFLEDDYAVKQGWTRIVEEGLALADYVTLYDHPDKYSLYPDLVSKVMATPSCHWRTTPSTTNSYAMKASTLRRDLAVHQSHCSGTITDDHGKFLELWSIGRTLISSLPAFWSHEEAGMRPISW